MAKATSLLKSVSNDQTKLYPRQIKFEIDDISPVNIFILLN